MVQELSRLFEAQDPVAFVLFALVCAGWVIVVERVILLQWVYRLDFAEFNTRIRKMLSAGDMSRARSYCLATSKVGLPVIVAKTIDAFETDAFKVRLVAGEEALWFLPRIHRRLSQLPNLATACILLGSLSAVCNLCSCFQLQDGGGLDSGLRQFVFGRGVVDAVLPLALSLGAALFLAFPYGILEAMATRLEGELEHSLAIVLNLLAPEMQPVFGGGALPNAGAMEAAESQPATPPPAEKSAPAAAKGSADDSRHLEHIESVADEEEII